MSWKILVDMQLRIENCMHCVPKGPRQLVLGKFYAPGRMACVEHVY